MEARRVTRAESAGLPIPSVEDLRGALATFLEQLAQTEQRIAESLATGLYRDANALAKGGPLADQSYYDTAVTQVGVDLGWTLTLEGLQADEVHRIFRTRLEDVVRDRDEAIRNGWRYKGERKVLAKRERFWEHAIRELSHWVTEADRERKRLSRAEP
jgi:hypothetical protein